MQRAAAQELAVGGLGDREVANVFADLCVAPAPESEFTRSKTLRAS
jgi:hypothetical protein